METWIDQLWTLREMPLVQTDAQADAAILRHEIMRGDKCLYDEFPDVAPATILPESEDEPDGSTL